MKRVVSVSLGSSKRDHRVETTILGEKFTIERVGTDGDMKRAIEIVHELDGKVDAFGLGGADLYVGPPGHRYMLRGALPLVRAAKVTPFLDGGGLKNTLERRVVKYMAQEGLVKAGQNVFIVCAMDRFGLAEAMFEVGARVVLGDLMFVLGIGVPIRSMHTLNVLASLIAPLACRLPLAMLYPIGKSQEKPPRPKFTKHYLGADIVAGDYHYIHRHIPDRLEGKTILTNTVTASDVEDLRKRGVATLVTTTPELSGRSFGTNVMEGVLVALAGKRPDELTPADYDRLLDQIGFKPRVQELQASAAS